MILGVILTSFGQAGLYQKGLLGNFRAKKGPVGRCQGREELYCVQKNLHSPMRPARRLEFVVE